MPNQTPLIPVDSDDDEGLSSLSDLAAEVIGDDALDFELLSDTQQRLKNITPPAERYPPLFDRDDEQSSDKIHDQRPKSGFAWGYNLLTLLFLIATGGLIVYFVYLWNNPFSPLNPLAPPTPYIQVTTTPFLVVQATHEPETPTPSVTVEPSPTPEPSTTDGPTQIALSVATDEAIITFEPNPTLTEQTTETPSMTPTQTVEATHTPEPSASMTETQTPEPTHTPTSSATMTATQTPEPSATYTPTHTLEPSHTPTPTLTHTPTASYTPSITPTQTMTPHPDHRFQLSDAGVIYRQNENTLACNWESITGKITDQRGNPLNNYRVRIIDVQDPTRFDVSVSTGTFANLGDGVYEQLLGNTPRAREYRLQVYDVIGLAVSAPITLTTRANCLENVAVVDFVQFR